MGYTTDFSGSFSLSKQPTPEQVAYINAFASTRRVKRNAEITKTLPDPIREAVGLPVGIDGGYYVGDNESGKLIMGKGIPEDKDDIIDGNTPPGQPSHDETRHLPFETSWAQLQERIKSPEVQPGLWCQWVLEKEESEERWNNAKQAYDHVPNDSEWLLRWDGGEKFYNYVEWLNYLIHNFFNVWGIKISGEVSWEGEDSSDLGLIVVEDSVVTVKEGKVVYE